MKKRREAQNFCRSLLIRQDEICEQLPNTKATLRRKQ
jgi:hypothetical protein